jgi:small subunit ribosomal protein S16
MLKIRLARVGKKKKPTYRLIVSEAARDTYGKALEILGHFNPFTKVIEVNKDRILYWISQGAKLSPTVHNLLVDQKVITGEKVRASKGKKRKKKKEKPAEKPKAEAKAEEKPEEKKPDEPKEERSAKEKVETKVEAQPKEKPKGEKVEIKPEEKKEKDKAEKPTEKKSEKKE